MPVFMYSVYVGNYESPSKAKNDIAKLNALGLKAFTFSRGDHYALKVFASTNKEKVLMTQKALENKGFITEFEELNLNQSLHIPG
jgi:hypothetical protein